MSASGLAADRRPRQGAEAFLRANQVSGVLQALGALMRLL